MAGGKRPGLGRKKGSPNKATADIKALARKYCPAAICAACGSRHKAKSEQPVAAIKELLDRGCGKSARPGQAKMEKPSAIP